MLGGSDMRGRVVPAPPNDVRLDVGRRGHEWVHGLVHGHEWVEVGDAVERPELVLVGRHALVRVTAREREDGAHTGPGKARRVGTELGEPRAHERAGLVPG